MTHLLTLRTLQDLCHRCHCVCVGDLRRPVRKTLNYVGWGRRSGRRAWTSKAEQGVIEVTRVRRDCVFLFPLKWRLDRPGVVLLTGAALLGMTGVTLGGGIPAAMSSRGWMMSLLKTAFFCQRLSTRTILLCKHNQKYLFACIYLCYDTQRPLTPCHN